MVSFKVKIRDALIIGRLIAPNNRPITD